MRRVLDSDQDSKSVQFASTKKSHPTFLQIHGRFHPHKEKKLDAGRYAFIICIFLVTQGPPRTNFYSWNSLSNNISPLDSSVTHRGGKKFLGVPKIYRARTLLWLSASKVDTEEAIHLEICGCIRLAQQREGQRPRSHLNFHSVVHIVWGCQCTWWVLVGLGEAVRQQNERITGDPNKPWGAFQNTPQLGWNETKHPCFLHVCKPCKCVA